MALKTQPADDATEDVIPVNRRQRRVVAAKAARGEKATTEELCSLPIGLTAALTTEQAALYTGLAVATLERRGLQAEAAAQATIIWESASNPDPTHPYLQRKRITGEGLRLSGRALLVPMRDVMGRIWNVQRIYPDGAKRFLKGGRIDRLFWLCGEPDRVLCIGEGMATVASVRRATGHAVAASITGANLEPASRELHALFPGADKVICADDDRALVDHPRIKRNLGLDYARAAAAAVGGWVAVPPGE